MFSNKGSYHIILCTLASKADMFATYPFIDPVDGNVFDINIPLFDGHPLMMMQDSKHLLKTFRNNAFSGA